MMGQAGGYEDYDFIAELYDYVVPYRGRPDVDFFVEAAQESGGPVLEVGCGTGRVLIPTARAGIEISGLDLSQHMLAMCHANLAQEAPEVQDRVDLQLADMRDFELGRTFALVTIPFRPFQHLTTVDDQMTCLRTIHRHLQPDGKLILDLFNPKLEALTERKLGEEHALEEPFEMPDGRRVRRGHVVTERDIFEQVLRAELIYYVTYPDGREERLVHAFPMRWLYRFEAEHLLARCGFEVEALYADYDKSPYGSQYPGELIFIAGKK
ncbi:MAG: class I SAM-dependent methyltransferase [Candidatus Promineifilaceae bacterium]|jgi:SAM-dependent methyltransferase